MNTFEIIPAVDILGGKCVRLEQGDFRRVSVYADNPLDMAIKWADQGAVRLHIVDLDAAKTGELKNIETIKSIIQNIKIPLQISGGIRSLENVKLLLDLGADRVILGTVAVENKDLLNAIAVEYKNKVAVSLDARGQYVATVGWLKTSQLTLDDMLSRVEKAGITRIVYTDISRDGVLKGANIEGISNVLNKTQLKVIASGGVSTLEDIINMKKLFPLGLEGCIIGLALYTGKIMLKEALRL